MLNNQILGCVAGVLLVSSSAVLANHDDAYDNVQRYQDSARVTSVTPEYESVNVPRQVCRNEYVRDNTPEYREEVRGGGRSYAGVMLGGLTGAIVGSRFGKGDGNSAAIAAGAIAGAMIGDKVQGNGEPVRVQTVREPRRERGHTEQRCYTEDNWEKRITAYRVTYEYAGRSYTTSMPNDPGRSIPIQVTVEPSFDRVSRNNW